MGESEKSLPTDALHVEVEGYIACMHQRPFIVTLQRWYSL